MSPNELAPRCRVCGRPMTYLGESADEKLGDRWYCRKDDELYFPREQHWGVIRAVAPTVQEPPVPPVTGFNVWFPILLLVGIILLGLFHWVLGVLGLVFAATYVYEGAKKFGIGGAGYAIATFLIGIIALPMYAYELSNLRKKQQTGRVRTLVQPTVPASTPSVTQRTSWKEWLNQPVGAKKAAEATEQTTPSTTPTVSQQASAISPSTKFCRKCGAKIPRDSVFCEECGSELIDAVASETPREPTPSVARRKAWPKSETIALFILFLILVWAVFPVFLRDTSPTLLLTSTGSGGMCTLKLQNRGLWPMVADGYWTFSPAIQWSGDGPATHFTLMPFTAYTFEYRYFVGGFCARGDTPPSVTLVGEVRLLYRTYQVEISSTNYVTD